MCSPSKVCIQVADAAEGDCGGQLEAARQQMDGLVSLGEIPAAFMAPSSPGRRKALRWLYKPVWFRLLLGLLSTIGMFRQPMTVLSQ